MKGPALLVAAFLAGLSVHESIVDACTTFCVKAGDTVIFGRNYDFEIGGGALIVNPRGLRKTGFLPRGPAWTSSYGSVTFNQFGRDFPMGGMNEKGWSSSSPGSMSRNIRPDGRSELGVLEWVQYQLDTAATVGDVIKSDAQVRIAGIPPLHYLVSDARAPPRPSSFSTTACRPHWKLTPHRRVGQHELRGLAHLLAPEG